MNTEIQRLARDRNPLNVDEVNNTIREIFIMRRNDLRKMIKVFPFMKMQLIRCEEELFDLDSPHRMTLTNGMHSLDFFSPNSTTGDNYAKI